MNIENFELYLYIFVAAAVTYVIRILPLTLIKKPIKNKFLRSFLYYLPYVTLTVMAFPAIINATSSPISGIIALAVGVVAALFSGNLFVVSAASCVSVLLVELFI